MSKSVEKPQKMSVAVDNMLENIDCTPSKDIAPFLKSILKNKSGRSNGSENFDYAIYWDSSFYGLDKIGLYNESSEEIKSNILTLMTRGTLEEGLFIEKSGMTYTAKMALLARENDERSLYNMLAADEATHFQLIASWMPNPRSHERQPFLSVLNQIVEQGGYASLIFIAQVLLEGWGLSHYMSLFKYCRNEDLKTVFKMILQDEAIHHGSGIVLTKKNPFTGVERDLVYTVIHDFFQMVRLGPVRMAREISEEVGGLTQPQLEQIFIEHGAEQKVHASLVSLLKIVEDHSPDPDLAIFIRKQGLDKPVSDTEFARYCKKSW